MLLKNFAIFAGKHLCWSLFLIKLRAFRYAATLLKRVSNTCFAVNIANFVRTTFSQNTFGLLLLLDLWRQICLKIWKSNWASKAPSAHFFLNDSFRSWLRIYWLEIKVIVTGNVTKLTTSSMDIIFRGAYLWCSFQIHNTSRDLRYTERWRFSVTPLWY